MRSTWKKTLPAALAAGALAVAGCGGDDPPGATSKAPGNGVDRAFVAAMIPHHESAIVMAKIAQRRGESQFVEQLADDIVASQSREIATMRREDAALDRAGIEPGTLGVGEHMMGMDDDPRELSSADPFDREFIAMMVPHHEGAIEMAKAELARGADPELKAIARDIVDAQQREIAAMGEHVGGSTSHSGHSG